MTVNLKTPEGQQLVRDLCEHCDVLVENFRPGQMERWGLGPDEIKAVNPDLIYTRISGYGQTGPYAVGRSVLDDQAHDERRCAGLIQALEILDGQQARPFAIRLGHGEVQAKTGSAF